MSTKITAPVPVSRFSTLGNLPFTAGVTYTNNPVIIEWAGSHGYTVLAGQAPAALDGTPLPINVRPARRDSDNEDLLVFRQ